MSGYVRIHRSLIGHPAFRNESETMAFAWLIAKASWRDVRVRYKGHSITLKRGQLAISQRDMAAAFDRDKAWIERLWKRLKSEAMIETATEAGVAVITICNYDEFQGDADEREAPHEARREAANEADVRQRRGTEQEGKKGRKVSSVAKATSPRTFALPDGVSPQVWADFLANRKRKRLGNTPTAWKAFCDDLARVSLQTGIPPPQLIEQCTAKGWGGIYDPREQQNEQRTNSLGRHQPSNDGLSSTARAALRVFGPD